MIIDFEELYTNFDGVYTKCQKSKKPIYLKCGDRVGLVVMNKDRFIKREQELMMQQLVLESYIGLLNGEPIYSIDEVNLMIDDLLNKNDQEKGFV